MKSRFVLNTKVCGYVLSLLLAMCFASAASATGTYNVVHEIMDWGPATTKIIIDIGVAVDACPIDTDAFTITVRRVDKRAEVSLLEAGKREVTNSYISDEKGNKVDQGHYITMELAYGPEDTLSSPMNLLGTYAWVLCDYTVQQQKDVVSNNVTISGFKATTLGEEYIPQMENFSTDGMLSFHDENYGSISLGYADYKPTGAFAGADFPLVIWLHGSEEGGEDASLPVTAFKACAFASDAAQEMLGGEAYVLAPQTATYWMDDGTQNPFEERRANGSKYTKALMHLIETYIEENPGIDPSRIYIGGGSNGGYMTMVMILSYPDFFAAAFPVSEAAADALIVDEELMRIIDMPIWFVHSASDHVVPATEFTLQTYERLVKLGAERVVLSYIKNVEDTSGRFRTAEGTAYEYSGHWAWVYVHNDELHTVLEGRQVSFLQWLGMQRKDAAF